MDEPTFDIFRGASKKDAVWIEAVTGLSNARQRLEQMAAASPGPYFVFDSLSHSIPVQIDTRKPYYEKPTAREASPAAPGSSP